MRIGILLAVAAAAVAQQPGQRFPVAGTVVNSVTSEPVARAVVRLVCPEGQEPETYPAALTDQSGRFQFPAVRAGSCSLEASKPQSFSVSSEGREERIAVGREPVNATLKLTPLAIVLDTVTDDRGEAWPGIRIQAFLTTYPEGRRKLQHVAESVSDDRGRFRFYGLAAGTYYFRTAGRSDRTLSYIGEVRLAEFPYESCLPTWSGGSPTLAGATPVKLEAGGKAAVDFRIAVRPGYTINGAVSNLEQYRAVAFELLRDGEPLSPGLVWSHPATGQFRMHGIGDGVYTLRATQGDAVGETQVSVSGADVRGVGVELVPATTVRFQVKTVGGGSGGSTGRIGLIGFETVPSRIPRAYSTQFKDGAASVEKVLPGRYRVTSPLQYTVASLRVGGRDLSPDAVITVPPGGLSEAIDIVLGPGCEAVAGRIEPGGGHVVFIPESEALLPCASYVRVDGKSRDFVVFLAPGRYRPWAWTGDEFEYANPELLRERATPGEIVEVTGGLRDVVVRTTR